MKFWNFKADNEQAEGPATLDIEGELVVDDGWWLEPGVVCARDFRQQLAQVGDVIVRINSPGGDVLAGAELYNALREHSVSGKGKVTVHVTALAASAASVVAMAGDQVLMNPTAYMMIHNPWSVGMGNADDLRQLADQLDEVAEGIVEAYRLKTGKSRAKLREMLDAETYMSAPTAIREGFADGLLYQPVEGREPRETEMAARTVAAKMVARMRSEGEGRRDSHAHGAAQDDVESRAHRGDKSLAHRARDRERRTELARRAELVARSLDSDGA